MITRLLLCVLPTMVSNGVASDDAARPEIRLTMITGAEVTGPLISFSNELVVLEVDGFPSAIGFDSIETDSACRISFELHTRLRGGRDRLTAADHYALGLFTLRRNRYALARRRFAQAGRLDASYRQRSDDALAAHRRSRRQAAQVPGLEPDDNEAALLAGSASLRSESAGPDEASTGVPGSDIERARPRIIAGYKSVGERIREQVGGDLVLLETPHFLIWTDWAKAEHDALRSWCEAMYTVVSRRFGMPPQANVFPGKCPVFCMRSKKRFRKVARLLDDYDATDALGYTSSSSNGHVHVVVRRQGGSIAGRDAFAATLIHETTHAFLHRYRTYKRVAPWLNEGLANFVAETVLGERCSNAETAAAAARAIVDGGHSIEAIFSNDDALDARYYPVAHSLVAFLIERDAEAFARLIDDIKLGQPVEDALERQYHMNLPALDAEWRRAHRTDKLD